MEKIRVAIIGANELNQQETIAMIVREARKHGHEITEDQIELISPEQARQFDKIHALAGMTKKICDELVYNSKIIKKTIRKDRNNDRYRSKFHNKKI